MSGCETLGFDEITNSLFVADTTKRGEWNLREVAFIVATDRLGGCEIMARNTNSTPEILTTASTARMGLPLR